MKLLRTRRRSRRAMPQGGMRRKRARHPRRTPWKTPTTRQTIALCSTRLQQLGSPWPGTRGLSSLVKARTPLPTPLMMSWRTQRRPSRQARRPRRPLRMPQARQKLRRTMPRTRGTTAHCSTRHRQSGSLQSTIRRLHELVLSN